jgi:hypothetical protein
MRERGKFISQVQPAPRTNSRRETYIIFAGVELARQHQELVQRREEVYYISQVEGICVPMGGSSLYEVIKHHAPARSGTLAPVPSMLTFP